MGLAIKRRIIINYVTILENRYICVSFFAVNRIARYIIVLHEVLALTVTKITQFATFTLYFYENGDRTEDN
jgi:hypothetical protein